MINKNVIALGNFDGFHLGHRKIIGELFRIKERENLLPVLVTFSPNPKVFFNKKIKLIFTELQKKEFIISLGVSQFSFMDFNKISKLPGRQFIIENLLNDLNMGHLVIGYNFKFGKNRDCDIATLKKLSMEFGFGLTIIAPVLLDNQKISSTLIRSKIKEGKIEEATKLLGYRPYIDGIVSIGIGRGKKLGFPTINTISDNKLLPQGVFQTSVLYENKIFDSITNIGVNPTFNNDEKIEPKIKIETHILNFEKSLYGDKVRIFFKKKIRDEKKFKSEKELIEQIKQDIG